MQQTHDERCHQANLCGQCLNALIAQGVWCSSCQQPEHTTGGAMDEHADLAREEDHSALADQLEIEEADRTIAVLESHGLEM